MAKKRSLALWQTYGLDAVLSASEPFKQEKEARLSVQLGKAVSLKLVRKTDDDLTHLMRIEEASFEPEYRFSTNEMLDVMSYPDFAGFYICVEDVPVGFINHESRGRGSRANFYISNIAVDPKYRGQGFGSALIELLEQQVQFEGASRITLHTMNITRNRAFYQSLGFEERGIVRGYYAEAKGTTLESDAVFYEKRFLKKPKLHAVISSSNHQTPD
ncbi:GNAT family N-acetyltransferase [Candidatus Woesearchaeota archaeon]|jgi:ribosomal protein S18 acetylase RimI-like enzyme|nr:GNAT family N-acetyltransferase [Candidatus Woesearchaeota archaeon]